MKRSGENDARDLEEAVSGGRSRKVARARPRDTEKAPGRQGPVWTTGSALTTKAITVGLALCILSGPVALALNARSAPAAAYQVPSDTLDLRGPSAAGDKAQEVVVAWLEATSLDSSRIESLLGRATSMYPEVGLEVRMPDVAQLTEVGSGIWSVTVGVDVLESVPVIDAVTGEKQSQSHWQRRYFVVAVQVTMLAQGPAVDVLSAPTPVAAPALVDYADVDYGSAIQKGAPIAISSGEFLSALLTGQSDVTRFITPEAPITAITPAPYAAVTVTEVRARADNAGTGEPGEGQQAFVLVSVDLVRFDGMKVPTTYALELVARAGRWEVAAISPSPVVTIDEDRPEDVPSKPTSVPNGNDAGSTAVDTTP